MGFLQYTQRSVHVVHAVSYHVLVWYNGMYTPLWRHRCYCYSIVFSYILNNAAIPLAKKFKLLLTDGDRINSVQLGQYYGCWSPDSLRRQDISTHDIDYIE